MLIGDVPRVNGQLAVARAFGDQSLKAHLSSEPDVKHIKINSSTEFVILASDGLWKVCVFLAYFTLRCRRLPYIVQDFDIQSESFLLVLSFLVVHIHSFTLFLVKVMKNQEAVDLVKSTKDPQTAAKRLTSEALGRMSKDDISCIVIRFRC